MDHSKKSIWRYAFEIGIVAGIILLYLGLVNMLGSFNEKELVRKFMTLGQVLLVIPTIGASLMIGRYARRNRGEGERTPWALIPANIMAAGLTALPSLAMLWLSQVIDVRSVLVNINRDWLDIITVDHRSELMLGAVWLVATLVVISIIISIFAALPIRLRKGVSFGAVVTLVVAMFGETVGLILQELLPEDWLDAIFRRDTIKQFPTLMLWIISTITGLLWAYLGDGVKQNYAGMSKGAKKGTTRVWQSLGIALLLALPWLIGRSLSDVAVTIGLFILMGLGLNIAIGLAGLLDLGYVTNYAVGAYVLAVLTSTSALGRGGDFLNFWTVLPIALLAAMFAGFIFAVPVLKMRGDYLAIATLGFGEIIGKLAISDWLRPYIGGAQGVLFIPKPNFFGLELKNPEQLYYVILAACVITLIVSIRLNNSRIGRQWMAIREDEDVALAMGIDTARSKLLAFTLSAATGGIAGAIFAAKVGTVFPKSFIVLISINVLSLIIVGGMGSNIGIIVGALILIGMPELLREFSEFRWLIYGGLLIFMMVRKPEGFIPSKIRQREKQNAPAIANEVNS